MGGKIAGAWPRAGAYSGPVSEETAVAREHRCGAVAPPAPLATEKQRRLCLTPDYPSCATFEAARAARPIAGGAISVSLVGLAVLFEIESRIEARDLAVLVHGRTLLETPASESRSLAVAAAGEAGRLGAREGGWVHFTVDAGRAGWVPASALMPIDPVQPARLTGLAPVR